MPVSPAPMVKEFLATEEQVLAEIPGGSQWVSHSNLLQRLARHTSGTRMPVSNTGVYYHLGELVKHGHIDQARRRVETSLQPKMEMHYRRRVGR